jgi:hypothetical protein
VGGGHRYNKFGYYDSDSDDAEMIDVDSKLQSSLLNNTNVPFYIYF